MNNIHMVECKSLQIISKLILDLDVGVCLALVRGVFLFVSTIS